MADSDLQIREGGGHPDPKMKEGRSQKILSRPHRASVWSKNNGRPSPGSAISSGGEY